MLAGRGLGGREPVRDAQGKNIGKIEDLMLDSNGRVSFAVMSFEGFLGIGDRLFAVPWNAMGFEQRVASVVQRRGLGCPDSTSPRTRRSASGSTGLTRNALKPASRARRRSSG